MSCHVLLLAVSLGVAAAVLTQAPRHESTLVLVDVAAEQADGSSAGGLTRDDFEIIADGATRPIEFFVGRERPLSLVLMFDVSDSMKRAVDPDALETAAEKSFVDRLAPEDRVRIGAFAKHLFLSAMLAVANRREVLAATRRALDPREEDTFGPSPVWDAAYTAVGALAGMEGRRAVVLVTDGRATGNRRSPEEVASHATSAGVSINVIGEDEDITIQQDSTSGVRVRPGARLEWIAAATGGRYLPDRGMPRSVGRLLAQTLADLRNRYTLGFEPPTRDGQVHALEVRIKRADLKVRSPRSFVAAARSLNPLNP